MCGADREAECAVYFAERVGANEVLLPFHIAQCDVLTIPTYALEQHAIVYTLLALGHAGDVSSAGPVQSLLPKRELAVKCEIVLKTEAAED